MAKLNEKEGTVVARCPGCNGAKSSFEWRFDGKELGAVSDYVEDHYWHNCILDFRLFRCAGCGRGGLGAIKYGGESRYPGKYNRLLTFYPESKDRLTLPKDTPDGIAKEFREGEKCMDAECYRAAVGMFRSVLDKTMLANGYKTNKLKRLIDQIDAAADDGIITLTLKKRAHEEIRSLGNDVLHDKWFEVKEDDVTIPRHYCQRILECFYDERKTILGILKASGKTPEDYKKKKSES